MDILCKHCGEPWDVDCIHDIPLLFESSDSESNYKDRRETFYKYGCGAFVEDWHDIILCPHGSGTPDEYLEELQSLLGDDVDGLAAETEDLLRRGYRRG